MQYKQEEMVERLQSITDEVWGLYAFRRDPIRGKFTKEEKTTLVNQAIACGREKALQIKKDKTWQSVYELATQLGLKVEYPDRPVGGGHIIFAQFVNPNVITIYKDSIDKAEKCDALQGIQVEQIVLAHEIFHYIEEQDENIFTRTEKIRLWKIGPFKNDSNIVCLSEIAGMAFAKELLDLEYSPFILDVLLVSLYHTKVSDALYEEIISIEEENSTSNE